MSEIIQLENKYYISVNSTYTDDRIKVLNHIDTFGIFDRWGDIKQLGEEIQGIYYNGMRFINNLEFRINDQRPLLLSSSIKEENEILSIDLTNPQIDNVATGISVPKDVLYIGRSKFIRNGSCFEQFKFHNYGNEPCEFEASFSISGDFKDIFEVRGIKRDKRGEIYETKHAGNNNILISYKGLDGVKRHTEIHFSEKPHTWDGYNKAIFRIKLEPQELYDLEYAFHFIIGDERKNGLDFKKAKKLLEEEQKETNRIIPGIKTSNQQFTEWISKSKFDVLSLLSETDNGRYPFAGVPWYNTAFGRDGIITAYETLWIAPDIARSALFFLAKTQATEFSEFQDAEPGKIIHEVRGGEMVELKEVPFKQYYGTVDATPLFIVLAGNYYRRTADLETIKQIWPNIEAALKWIDKHGDIDGDGFVDYHHKSVNGLINQGWKDSHDSIMHSDGTLVVPPVALCEVQGYVYDAKIQASMLAAALDDTKLAVKLKKEAEELKRRFNEQFWDEELQCFVLALDGQKKPCRVVTSNAGHCLFSGIADDDKAKKVAARLLQDDMFTGWGIRTLSSKEVRYNPMSYHNGSVWPHDVAIIAMGFARYGLQQEVLTLTKALFECALFIERQRLPELFCGFDRRKGEGPTHYPVACSPQAWSVGAVYLLLKACMHIETNTSEKKVYFRKPVLPENVNRIEIEQLKIGDDYAHLELYCEKGTVGVRVISCPPDWQVLLVT